MDENTLRSRLKALSKQDEGYPKAWKNLPDAPPTLYGLGNFSLLSTEMLTVVGSRRTSANALKLGENIAETLSQTLTIVTGTADGGDQAAAEGGLKHGRVIALLAGGFSALPQSNLSLLRRIAKEGLLLSPCEFDAPVRSFSYEYRNKLLAALGVGTFVLGAGEKSGALITAKYAQKFKKPVFAFPYPPNAAAGAGCNALIKQGAYLVESAEDVAKPLGLDLTAKRTEVSLSADEQKLYQALQELCEGHVTELSQKSGVPPFKARAVLSALEVKGLVAAVGGNRYALV